MGLGASNTTSHLSRINDRNLGMVQINNNQIHNNTNSINIWPIDPDWIRQAQGLKIQNK